MSLISFSTTLHHICANQLHFPPLLVTYYTYTGIKSRLYQKLHKKTQSKYQYFASFYVFILFLLESGGTSHFFSFILIRMIHTAETTTSPSASAIDTGYPIPGIKSWSVLKLSIQNLPTPYPKRYNRKISPSNFLCLVYAISIISRTRFHSDSYKMSDVQKCILSHLLFLCGQEVHLSYLMFLLLIQEVA